MLEVFGPWHYAAVAVQYWSLISSTKVSTGAFGRLWSSWHGLVTIMGPALKKCCCSVRDISKGVHFCNNNLQPSQYVRRKIVLVVVLIEKALSTLTHLTPLVKNQKLQQILKSWLNFSMVLSDKGQEIPCSNLEKSMYQFWQIRITI